MSREAKEEKQDTTQIEINNSTETDNNAPSTPDQKYQTPDPADEELEHTETETEEEEEGPPPTPKEVKELRQQASKSEEYYERLQRQVAEADNLRKRLAKEKQDAVRYANESLIEQLLPTMDSFEMAMSAVQNADNSTIDSLKTGIEMVYTQLKRTLEEVGLIEIDATGQKFDPSQHEAVSRKKTDEADEGTVMEQTRKGYRLRDRLLRAASVVVATPSEEANEQ
jgi:molecular chaperone GrpE